MQSYSINSGSRILGNVSEHTAAEIQVKTTYTVPLLVLGQQAEYSAPACVTYSRLM